jgi:hypothetical protein
VSVLLLLIPLQRLPLDGATRVRVLVITGVAVLSYVVMVSTARQGRSGLGLEAQQAALAKFCDAEAFKLVETYTETESGADDDRPS